jgi:hypothetical protein
MGRKMELAVINSFDLKPRWELVMVFGNLSTAQDVYLGLHWDRWSEREAVDVDPVM